MTESYIHTRTRLEEYFDRTAVRAWERLTSDAPVSRIRRTVREGRDRMRALLLDQLPGDLTDARVLDAGCGAGQMAVELARRGAQVTAADISPRLLAVARDRCPLSLADRVEFVEADMLDRRLGTFDYVVAMDSLIHYRAEHVAEALSGIADRTVVAVVFTIAPRTALLSAMHLAGRMLPRGDRAPAIVPIAAADLSREVPHASGRRLRPIGRVACGFYISEAIEFRP